AGQPQPFSYNAVAGEDWEGLDLTVTAILRPREGLAYGSMQSGIYYTPALTDYIIQNSMKSEIVEFLNKNGAESYGMFTGNNAGIFIVPSFSYDFYYDGNTYNKTAFVYNTASMTDIMSMFTGSTAPSLTLRDLGGVDIPNTISVYPVDFTYKSKVTEYLDKWNGEGDVVVGDKTIPKEKREDIVYTDNIELIISLVNDLIDMITFALVAFTSLSLVVSTVMIAIITYVSVIERIKEIGVIRALGGRKRDVSRLFTAETLIIGIAAGVLGIIITFILTLIINGIVQSLAGISIATLTVPIALIMICISAILTLISGLIPARLAAKKDPVEALRSE
ncbi:MAG: FtsX-like permease family protein, partial [Clostridiales bacterium]|nr:FtsX-like permease family protein [Clostridiales bacterium]